jgi:hypothetical protein
VRATGFPTFVALTLAVVPGAAQKDFATPRQDTGIAPRDVGEPRATMTCEHVPIPGRVRCEVEARVPPGYSISWGDVVLRRVPAFVAPLRGRVGPHDASVREPGLWRWPFALVAHGKGAGEVEGQVRVVLCRERSCAAVDLPVVGEVEVGSP